MKSSLKRGANINWQNPSNLNSPAHVAAWMGYVELFLFAQHEWGGQKNEFNLDL